MAKTNTLPFTQNLNGGFQTWTNSDAASTKKTLLTAGSDDEVVTSIGFTSDDTSTRVWSIYVNDGSTDQLIGAVSVTTLAGTNGTTATIDAISSTLMPHLPLNALGKRVLPMKTGWVLKAMNQTQVTSGKTVTAAALSEKY